MTTEAAIKLAQQIHPLDIVARMDYIEMKRDTCDIDDLRAWTAARDLTRNGVTFAQGADCHQPLKEE